MYKTSMDRNVCTHHNSAGKQFVTSRSGKATSCNPALVKPRGMAIGGLREPPKKSTQHNVTNISQPQPQQCYQKMEIGGLKSKKDTNTDKPVKSVSLKKRRSFNLFKREKNYLDVVDGSLLSAMALNPTEPREKALNAKDQDSLSICSIYV